MPPNPPSRSSPPMMLVSIVLRARSISSSLRRLRTQQRQLLFDGFLQLLHRVSRTRGGLDLENRSQHQRVLLRRHVLRNLLLVDQLLVEAARASAAENRRGDVRIGIAWLQNRRGQPGHVHARQLDARVDDLAALGRDLRRLGLDRRNRRAALQRCRSTSAPAPSSAPARSRRRWRGWRCWARSTRGRISSRPRASRPGCLRASR